MSNKTMIMFSVLKLWWTITIAILSHIISYFIADEKKIKPLKGWYEHDKITSEISKLFIKKNENEFICIKGKKSSVCSRSNDYKKNCRGIDVSKLDSVICINGENNTAWIESNCKMGEITDILLEYGYILKITPELENISIGGSFQGLGVETSSFKFGMMHHIIKRVEIILPNGEIIKIKREYNDDENNNNEYDGLFQCISGSFNSIAFVVAVEIE
eukprot:193093_1